MPATDPSGPIRPLTDPRGTPLYRSRYPEYDVLERAKDWDEVTRSVLLDRVTRVPPLEIFTGHAAGTLQALADTIVPQSDRPEHLRIPLLHYLDERIANGEAYGYRFETIPHEPDFWFMLVEALDDETRLRHACAFADAAQHERDDVFDHVARENVRSRRWERLDLAHSVPAIISEFASHYYGHPYAWSEIGFGGPKFPRIYARLKQDNPEEAVEDPAAARAAGVEGGTVERGGGWGGAGHER